MARPTYFSGELAPITTAMLAAEAERNRRAASNDSFLAELARNRTNLEQVRGQQALGLGELGFKRDDLGFRTHAFDEENARLLEGQRGDLNLRRDDLGFRTHAFDAENKRMTQQFDDELKFRKEQLKESAKQFGLTMDDREAERQAREWMTYERDLSNEYITRQNLAGQKYQVDALSQTQKDQLDHAKNVQKFQQEYMMRTLGRTEDAVANQSDDIAAYQKAGALAEYLNGRVRQKAIELTDSAGFFGKPWTWSDTAYAEGQLAPGVTPDAYMTNTILPRARTEAEREAYANGVPDEARFIRYDTVAGKYVPDPTAIRRIPERDAQGNIINPPAASANPLPGGQTGASVSGAAVTPDQTYIFNRDTGRLDPPAGSTNAPSSQNTTPTTGNIGGNFASAGDWVLDRFLSPNEKRLAYRYGPAVGGVALDQTKKLLSPFEWSIINDAGDIVGELINSKESSTNSVVAPPVGTGASLPVPPVYFGGSTNPAVAPRDRGDLQDRSRRVGKKVRDLIMGSSDGAQSGMPAPYQIPPSPAVIPTVPLPAGYDDQGASPLPLPALPTGALEPSRANPFLPMMSGPPAMNLTANPVLPPVQPRYFTNPITADPTPQQQMDNNMIQAIYGRMPWSNAFIKPSVTPERFIGLPGYNPAVPRTGDGYFR